MSLTGNQKHNLRVLRNILITCVLFGGFIGGLFWLVTWSDTVTRVQHYCAGKTGITITDTHGNGENTTVNWTDPKCK